MQLEGLISIYNLNADQKIKSKAFSSLQFLESDILQLFDLQCSYLTDPFDIIYKSDVGLVLKRRGGMLVRASFTVETLVTDFGGLTKIICDLGLHVSTVQLALIISYYGINREDLRLIATRFCFPD